MDRRNFLKAGAPAAAVTPIACSRMPGSPPDVDKPFSQEIQLPIESTTAGYVDGLHPKTRETADWAVGEIKRKTTPTETICGGITRDTIIDGLKNNYTANIVVVNPITALAIMKIGADGVRSSETFVFMDMVWVKRDIPRDLLLYVRSDDRGYERKFAAVAFV